MARGIYERLKTMERNICSHLGVSPPNVHNTLKMKADDDNHGLSDSPKTVGIQKQWPPRKSRRASSTVTKPTKKIHSYPLRSADGLQNSQGNIGCTPPYFNKESGANYDCAHDRTPPFDEHVNYQEPRTPYAVPDESNSENPVTTVTVYNPLIFVRPQSYVSPTKLQEEQPGAVETLPGSDTDEDDNSVESDVKQWKRDYDRCEMVLFANQCIPKICVCGGPITLATDDKGMSYYKCKEYEDDGLHIRHRCFDAIKEELEELKKKVAEEANNRMNDDELHSRHRCFDAIEEELLELKNEVAEESNSRMKMEDELKEMREDIRLLKELCM
ncbi:unnamed protein product [Brassica oleracea]